MKILLTTAMVIFVLLGVTACGGGYYKVKDLGSDNIYYTKDLEQNKGSVVLKDANTGSTVTLQNSEVIEINKEEFNANTKKEK